MEIHSPRDPVQSSKVEKKKLSRVSKDLVHASVVKKRLFKQVAGGSLQDRTVAKIEASTVDTDFNKVETAVQPILPVTPRPTDSTLSRASFMRDFCRIIDSLFLVADKMAQDIRQKNGILLRKAVDSGQVDEVRALLRKGVNLEDRDEDGTTILMVAASLGSVEVVQALLEAWADIHAKNYTGFTPLRFAASHRQMKVFYLLRNTLQEQYVAGQNKEWLFLEHEDLIVFLRSLYGEKANLTGVCHGFALMGMQAILSDHVEQFDARLESLTNLVEICAIKKISFAKVLQEGREKAAKEEKSLSSILQESFREVSLDVGREQIVDILAFFEGIQVCMKGGKVYPHLFNKEELQIGQSHVDFVKSALSIIGSEAFLQQGNFQKMGDFSGVYTKEGLVDYFTSLEKIVKEQPVPKRPIAFRLVSPNHAITVGYDPKKKSWICVGVQNIFMRHCKDPTQLADAILAEFVSTKLSDGSCPMGMSVCVLEKTEEDIAFWKEKIEKWQSSPEFTRLHQVDPSCREKNNRWFDIACLEGDSKGVEKLAGIEIEVNANLWEKVSPLLLAVESRNIDLVKALLRREIEGEQQLAAAKKALFTSIERNYDDVVSMLLEEFPLKIDEENEEGVTPLHCAAEKGNRETFQVLLVHGADVTKRTAEDRSLLDLAVESGSLSFLRYCTQLPSVSIDEQDDLGFTALMNAVLVEDEKAVQVLLKAGADPHKINNRGSTALTLARQAANKTIEGLLKETR